MLIKILKKVVEIKLFQTIVDLILVIYIAITFLPYKIFTIIRSKRLPFTAIFFEKIGLYPIRDQYYEPLFQRKYLDKKKFHNRRLGKINFNLGSQIRFINNLEPLPSDWTQLREQPCDIDFDINNGAFAPGDAEFLYHFIRNKKPKKIYEIGAGQSTKVICAASKKNKDEGSVVHHTCIEPYEAPWLEDLDVHLIREGIETVNLDLFKTMEEGDLLFIDSSHMIRPQGDVLTEYLEIIPVLKAGVYIHIHDIFTPNDYPEEWIVNQKKFWNEQYLVEMMLINSDKFEIFASLNHLKHKHFSVLAKACPYITKDSEPGSMYLKVLS